MCIDCNALYPNLWVRSPYLLSSLKYDWSKFLSQCLPIQILRKSPYYSVHYFIFLTSLWIRLILRIFLLDWLWMPSDKHSSRTAKTRDLNSSLINVASSRDVPFHQPQELQCLHHGATFVPLWSPILSSQPRKVMICGRHVMASVRDIKIDEVLLILCFAYYVMKRVRQCWNWGVMAFTHRVFHEYFIYDSLYFP